MGQFLKQIYASLIGSFAGLILFFVLGTSGLVLLLIAAVLTESGPTVKDKTVLVFDLSTQISDTQPPSTLSQVLSEEPTPTVTLRQVLDAIDKARKDRRIVAIFLDGRKAGTSNGYATLKEVRMALERFRAAGKKIIAYDVDVSEQEYYLTSVADTSILNPMGAIEVNGLNSQPLFLADAFKKYGIGVQVVRVGSYKSAVEPYTRPNLSPENRQQIKALLDDLWGDFLNTVEKSRKVPAQKLQQFADTKGILDPEEARTAGLIDRVAYFDNVLEDLKQMTGEEKEEGLKTFRQIDLPAYAGANVTEAQKKSSRNKIAVLYAEGAIVSGQGAIQEIGGDRFAKELRKLKQNEDVKAVVLRINSPGGSATASEIILREVQLLREQKPVIVSMGDVAASGGYWIATGGNRIFAEGSTITGSIGVFGLLFNLQEIANNNGISWDVVKTARLADLGTATRPKTKEELAILQRSVNQIYEMFLDKVAKSRNMPKERVAQIAQGRVWSGEDAKKIGLVDQIGGIDAAIQEAANQANLGDDWEVEEYPAKRSFEAELLARLLGTEQTKTALSHDPLTVEFLKFKKELTTLQTLNDPQGIYSRLPFNWSIE
ncbi:signal peptide peptidase SppA, 67K type [Pleurocapsa sp. PCC 7327]|uniref:signal peptide peptidase SppA n=1 Tax=Pleurocapsa sp. PCC 7327 TaxID=118163 RepID=UPI00029FE0AE|nr:signal peptide peptidase SppA [Pleurocapsa sp. PCC 7327]AFY76670.1 signal peptide peptidase SppA, 67K type [Pleurocapsa sp. PCC 7327]